MQKLNQQVIIYTYATWDERCKTLTDIICKSSTVPHDTLYVLVPIVY